MQHQRHCSFDESSARYGHSLSLQHGDAYSAPSQQNLYGHQPSAGQYYPPIPSAIGTPDERNNQCYQNALSTVHQGGGRYPIEHASDSQYYNSQGLLPSSSSVSYGTQHSCYGGGHYSNTTAPRSQHAPHTPFIPTPSELTQTYANYSHHMRGPQSSGHPPEHYASNQEYKVPRSPLQQPPPRISTSSGTRTGPGSSPTAPTGERFPCEKCGKTFSRSHDRKRHHETQHLPTPVIHHCRYCEKNFSRADSLKRHLDNGCDEMP